jgi:putative nucleotidyltransferase with HDIG domain
MAPFDFAINKSDSELSAEKESVLKSANPYFRLDENISAEKIGSFKNELEETLSKKNISSEDKKNHLLSAEGAELLSKVYSKGIIQPSPSEDSHSGEQSTINLLKNNISEEKNASNFFSILTAYEFIGENLKKYSTGDSLLLAPLLENALTYNIRYDDAATEQWTKQLLENISVTRGMVQSGEAIVHKGEVVDKNIFQKLTSLKAEMLQSEFSPASRWMQFLGHFILVSLAVMTLIIFLFLFRREIYNDNQRIMLLLLLLLLITLIFLWSSSIDLFDTYLIPICILPIVVRAFYDTRTALFTHVCLMLIIGFQAPTGFEFFFIQIVAGMASVFSMVNMSRRAQFFISVGTIFFSYAISFSGVALTHPAQLSAVDWNNMKWFAGNSILTLFAFPLIFIFEKTFGLISDISLMELTDSNSKLLRELAMKAPGTFQHSLQVANLAEAAVYKVGGNPLLVRTGAMYHDIGKMDMPAYFIENQSSNINPHDELTFEESARIIKSHVIKGIEKARSKKIPEPVIDFIRTHHGTSLLQYFYQSFLKNHPGEIPDDEKFCYPGPLPFSKETAVLMMADSVEAASKSLKRTDEKSIDALVEKIINGQIQNNQFINSPVTLKDIQNIKQIFKKMLISIHHVRVEYPQ